MCKTFNCDKRHGNFCCGECPEREKCKKPCLNSKEKCGLYVRQTKANKNIK